MLQRAPTASGRHEMSSEMTARGEVPVGDPSRVAVGRSLLWCLAAAIAFTSFAFLTTQYQPLRAHSPWQDDPYDVVVSFTQFVVPAAALGIWVRMQLCRPDLPQPSVRLRDLLRAGRLALTAIGLTAASDWIAVALGVHHQEWGAPGFRLIAALAGLSLLTLAAAASVTRTSRQSSWSRAQPAPDDPDWFDDGFAVLTAGLTRLGNFAVPGRRWLTRAQAIMLDGRHGMRRHRAGTAAVVSVGLAGALAISEGVHEGGLAAPARSTILVLVLTLIGASGFFGILLAAGSYLRVLRPGPSASAASTFLSRILTGGALAAATSVPVTVAFRDLIEQLTGHRLTSTTPGQFGAMILVVAATATVIFVVVALICRSRCGLGADHQAQH